MQWLQVMMLITGLAGTDDVMMNPKYKVISDQISSPNSPRDEVMHFLKSNRVRKWRCSDTASCEVSITLILNITQNNVNLKEQTQKSMISADLNDIIVLFKQIYLFPLFIFHFSVHVAVHMYYMLPVLLQWLQPLQDSSLQRLTNLSWPRYLPGL